jgi:heavy metal translocating P-type ATPase
VPAFDIAHRSPGRLRLRFPIPWVRRRGAAVERRLREMGGVRGVTASDVTGSLRIEYDPFRLAEQSLLAQLEELTRGAARPARAESPGRATGRPSTSSASLVTGARASLVGAIGASSVLLAACLPFPSSVVAPLVLAAEVPALLRAAAALRRRRLNGDVLEASTLLTLTARSNYVAAALLTALRAVGDHVVARTVQTTRRSLHELAIPADDPVRTADGRRLPAGAVIPGDVLVVEGPSRVPVDGVVVAGEALVNQQTMTGEALPVEREPGDTVYAATTVEHGRIEVRALRVGLDTSVGRIVQAIGTAAAQRSRIQVYAERLADREVGRSLTLAGLGMALSRNVDAGVAILVSDYGLAARVGVPTALVASLRRAVPEGILIKGPRPLETLAKVDTVVFDKTGTLTTGTPRVTRVAVYLSSLDEREVIRLVAGAEQGFRHPVARAVERLAREWELSVPVPDSTIETTGLGVDVRIEGHRVQVGSRRFMESHEIVLRAAAADEAAAHAAGASPAFVAIDSRLAALLVLDDELRPDAPAAVAALRARRMRNVILLTGDHPQPARVIAESLGLRHYYPELLPEDKARLIRELQAEDRVVAMVGDGVNDALALRQADVGIAVPGGAEITAEAADVVVLQGGLDRVVRALDLAGEALAAVRGTLAIAARANLAVVGMASIGIMSPLVSILITHGSAVAAGLVLAADPSTLGRWASTSYENVDKV